MAWRSLGLTGILLIVYALLWLGWMRYQRSFTRKRVIRAMVFAFLGVFFFLQFAGGAVSLPVQSCIVDDHDPPPAISFRPPGDLLNLSPAAP